MGKKHRSKQQPSSLQTLQLKLCDRLFSQRDHQGTHVAPRDNFKFLLNKQASTGVPPRAWPTFFGGTVRPPNPLRKAPCRFAPRVLERKKKKRKKERVAAQPFPIDMFAAGVTEWLGKGGRWRERGGFTCATPICQHVGVFEQGNRGFGEKKKKGSPLQSPCPGLEVFSFALYNCRPTPASRLPGRRGRGERGRFYAFTWACGAGN